MKYILFVKKECPYCIAAQELLTQSNKDFKIVDFSKEQEGLLSEIKAAYEWGTVPMIFCREKNNIQFIGGYTDLQRCLGDV